MRGVTVPAIAVLVASAVLAVGTPPGPAQSQQRPGCTDGEGLVRDQVRGEILDAILPDWVIDHPFGAEEPADLWARCADPYFDGTGSGDDAGAGSGSIWGDPHVVTQDGAAYDLQAAGDVVLVTTDDDRVEVQARHKRVGPITYFDGVAVGTPAATVAVEGYFRSDVVVTVDDEVVDNGALGWTTFDGGVVSAGGETVTILLDDGVVVRAADGQLDLHTPAAWAGTFRGVQGNGDGDPTNDVVRRDGTPIDPDDPEQVYGAWLDDWLVAPADSLFATPFDLEEWGPIRPGDVVSLADLPPGDVASAAAVCVQAGWTPGAGLEQCTFDVALTGEQEWAEGSPAAAGRSMAPVAAFEPTVDVTIDLDDATEVGPGQPVAGAGTLAGGDEADDFRLAPSVTDRWLVPVPPCAAPLAAVALVVVDDRPTATLPLSCGTAAALPAGAATLRIMDPGGLERDYAFRISDTPDTSVAPSVPVEATVGSPVDLVVGSPGQVPTARLELAAGQRIYVETIDSIAVGLRLDGPDGEPLAEWPQFLDSGVVTAATTGAHVLSAEPVLSNTGTVTVLAHDVPDDVVVPAAVGDEVALEVVAPGQKVGVEVDLDAGDVIEVETLEPIPGMYRLMTPDDVEVANWPHFLASGPMTATASGTHTIVFEPVSTNVGPLRFTIRNG